MFRTTWDSILRCRPVVVEGRAIERIETRNKSLVLSVRGLFLLAGLRLDWTWKRKPTGDGQADHCRLQRGTYGVQTGRIERKAGK